MQETHAKIVGIQAPGLADVFKRESPVIASSEYPGDRFLVQPSLLGIPRMEILLEADDRVFQDGEQQPLFRLKGNPPFEGPLILLRRQLIRLKEHWKWTVRALGALIVGHIDSNSKNVKKFPEELN